MIECPLPSYFPKNTDNAAILIRFVGTAIGTPWGRRGFEYSIADQGLSSFPHYLGNGGEYAYGNSEVHVGTFGQPTTPFDVEEEFSYWYTPEETASLSLYVRGVVGTSGIQQIDLDYVAAYLDIPVVTSLKVNRSHSGGRFL